MIEVRPQHLTVERFNLEEIFRDIMVLVFAPSTFER
jgi:hypothetical protein